MNDPDHSKNPTEQPQHSNPAEKAMKEFAKTDAESDEVADAGVGKSNDQGTSGTSGTSPRQDGGGPKQSGRKA